MTTIKDYGFKRASTIVIPDQMFQPIITGKKEIDDAWSELGGIVPSQVTLVTGKPGVGKTTLLLAIAGMLSEKYRVAFVSLEMSEFQLAHQARKIKGFGNVFVTQEFDQNETFRIFAEIEPELIIFDSIQKGAKKMRKPDGNPMPFTTAQYEIAGMFTAYAKRTWAPVMLIGHCDKSGNYKGPSDMLHDVDSHLSIEHDKDTDMRQFGFEKNRFGGIIEPSMFGITRETVWIGSPFNDVELSTSDSSTTTDEQIIFCRNDLNTKWDKAKVRIAIRSIVNLLKRVDDNFSTDSCIKDAEKVKVTFNGDKLAHCHPLTGELVFGSKILEPLQLSQVGYRKEKPYINLRVKTQFQLLEWLIIHEWCHLYEGMTEHDHKFFTFITAKFLWYQDQVKIVEENMKDEQDERTEEDESQNDKIEHDE